MDEIEIKLSDLHNYGDEYEVYDEELNKWVNIKSSCYMKSGGFPDIEKADKEITAITLSRKGEKVVLGLFPYKAKSDKVTYIHCKDEWTLLNNFLKVWQSGRFMPDIVTGWNIEFFDIPYIVNRIRNILGEHEAKKLSPWGFLEERSIELHGKEHQVFIPSGISVLDYLPLYKKFKFETQESYKLDSIAESELGIKKLDYSQYGSLHELYINNFELFIDYNIHDTTLIDLLEERLKFIEQVMAFAYDAKVNYNDTLTTVRPWDVIIHNYLMDRGIVIPSQVGDNVMDTPLMGGYVKEPKIGMSKWVVSFDLDSLYPHLIMQYSISPDTLISDRDIEKMIILFGKSTDKDDLLKSKELQHILDNKKTHVNNLLNKSFDTSLMKKHGFCYTANGALFSKNKQGFLAALMEKMYNDRVLYKDQMKQAKKKLVESNNLTDEEKRQLSNDIAKFHNLQLAKKIQLNSAYGALANAYFRWFNFTMAESITSSGQLAIQWIEKRINAYLNSILETNNIDYIIASDTDSIYVTFESMVDKYFGDIKNTNKIVDVIDKFCKVKIQKVIKDSYEELADYMNAYQQKMSMKRETIADKGIWKAKKMYILNAWDIEGVRFPEAVLKIQGIEAVRSSTPKVCRSKIKEALKIIMNEDENTVQEFIRDFKKEFFKMSFSDIAFPRGMNNMKKYSDRYSIFTSGTPIHVKGALLYNDALKRLGLGDKYEEISDGDKIKFIYLKTPNTLKNTVISCPSIIPKEFELDKFIDYEKQFEKTFLVPVKNILDVIDWRAEYTNTLEAFF